jgi:curved DNA-binding protein CbpA
MLRRNYRLTSAEDKMARDPYDTLGVDRDADDEEIRRAYHRRAKEEHPDAGGQTDDFFCRLNEAYEEIRTADRRREYDRRRHRAHPRSAPRPGREPTGRPFEDAAGGPFRRPHPGEPHLAGTAGLFDLFERVFAGRGGPWSTPSRWGPGNRTGAAGHRRARSHRLSVDISPAEARRGLSLEVALPDGRQRIDLPADLRDGDELTFHERDAAGGELYVTVDVRVRSRSR